MTKTAGEKRKTIIIKQRWGHKKTQHCATQRFVLQPTVTTSSYSFRKLLSNHRECWWHYSRCKRTCAQQAGSASGRETTWSKNPSTRPHRKIILDLPESSVKSRHVCRTQKPSALQLQHNPMQTGKRAGWIASHQQLSGKSSQQQWPTDSPFCHHPLLPYTSLSMHATWWLYKLIAHWHTQETTYSSRPPSSGPFFRSTSLQSLTLTLRQEFPHWSPLHNR